MRLPLASRGLSYTIGFGPRRVGGILAVLAIPVLLAACGDSNPVEAQTLSAPGDVKSGRQLIHDFGCGSCHTIPGINEADAMVGPPLNAWSRRIYIAGLLRNTPPNLATWIQHPQQIVPGNAMPDMGITQRQAQDIAAYLYTLR
jgi:cytochrome c2